tara:strand:- start:811 stop:1365 length:555 start_codon:yes stop_codon:yes gene_type:complete
MEELPIQNPNANFAGPIPGASLTTEVGNRPWENPPKESSLDKVINNYLNRLQNPNIVFPILDAIKYGTSITTIVESVIETAVMEGEHTIDIGVLASPVIVEYLKQASEVSKINYKLSAQDIREAREPKKIDDRLLEEVLREKKEQKDSPMIDELEASAKEIKTSSKKGLMSKKENIEDSIDGRN